MGIFDNIQGQYIDDHGKTRMIVYDSGLCMMTSPLAPLNTHNVPLNLKPVDSKIAVDFIKANGLVISQVQNDEKDMIIGLWLECGKNAKCSLHHGYIPIHPKKSEYIKKIGIKDAPLFFLDVVSKKESSLDKERQMEIIANHLKQYTLFEYSNLPENKRSSFVEKFIVVPNHIYNVSKLKCKLFTANNDVIYLKGKIVVTSDEMKERLVEYAKVYEFNNKNDLESYKYRTKLANTFNIISDFKHRDGELMFETKKDLLDNIKKRDFASIHLVPDLTGSAREPYFYRNSNINNGKLCIMQNVPMRSLNNTLHTTRKWNIDKINMGYVVVDERDYDSKEGYVIYDLHGNIKESKGGKQLSIMMIEEDVYVAMLFVEN